jgi:hypothetical protein
MAMTPATSNERCDMVGFLQGARKRSRTGAPSRKGAGLRCVKDGGARRMATGISRRKRSVEFLSAQNESSVTICCRLSRIDVWRLLASVAVLDRKRSASKCVEALFRATVARKKAEGEVQLANGRTQNTSQRSDAESSSERGRAHARASPWIFARVSF